MENKKELRNWLDAFNLDHPLVIAGPCSAETEEQVLKSNRTLQGFNWRGDERLEKKQDLFKGKVPPELVKIQGIPLPEPIDDFTSFEHTFEYNLKNGLDKDSWVISGSNQRNNCYL